MNSANGERIMYYDAEQRKFIVDEISLDSDEANDTTASNETTQATVSAHHVI